MRKLIAVVLVALSLAIVCGPTEAQKKEPITNPYTYYHIDHHWPYPPRPPYPPLPPRPPYPPTPVRPWPYPVPYPIPYPVPTPYPVPDGSGTFISNPYTVPGSSGPASSTYLPTPKTSQAVIVIMTPTTQTDLWVDGNKMPPVSTQTRVFNSPDLDPEHKYVYNVKAQWIERGEKVTREQAVQIQAGKTSTVDFTKK